MENSSASSGLQYHLRSISLPSRLHHPHSIKIESELNKLKTWETSLVSPAPISAETIRTGLVGLADLYICVEELISSPITQQALLQHQNGLLVEEALQGSIGLLDLCSIARDLVLMMKEHVHDLQSVLRRKGGDISIESNISAYLCCKKKAKKETAKCLRAMKQMENKMGSSPLFDVNHYLSMVIRVLRDVACITISVLRSIFLFFSVPATKANKISGWSLMSKLLTTSPLSKTGHKVFNEVGSVDVALHSLRGRIRNNDTKIDVQMARRRLQAIEGGIEGLDAGLDCLFRHLMKNRVSLLNILAH